MPLEIAPEKVAHAIIKAREYAAKVGPWNATTAEGDADEDPGAILEDFAGDPTLDEFTGFIDALNDDEQAHLVALAWIGRGTYEPGRARRGGRRRRRRAAWRSTVVEHMFVFKSKRKAASFSGLPQSSVRSELALDRCLERAP